MNNKNVLIYQLGETGGVTAALAAGLRRFYDIGVTVGPLAPVPAPAYDAHRSQFSSRMILAVLEREKAQLPEAAGLIWLGVTAVDLFVPRLNFVFGEADQAGGVAVISAHRLRPEYYGEPRDAALLQERLLKEAIHELGHVFGLGHCEDPSCIMHFSNTVVDTDRKGPGFCAGDRAELAARGIKLV